MPGRFEFDVGLGRTGRRREPAEPMRLLVLGEFSGKAAVDRPPLATRTTQRVDIDNLDDLIRRWRPTVTRPAGEIRFEQVDDFHPDRLYARLDLFEGLRQARANPPSGNDDLLGRLLGKPPDPIAPPGVTIGSRLDAMIREVVAPHIVKDPSAQARVHAAAADVAMADEMRTILHDPAFQSLEAAWRGVRWLLSNLELDENLQLHLFDVSRDELLGNLVEAKGQIEQTGLHRALVERWHGVPGAHGWSALIGLFQFGPALADVGLLAAFGLIASRAGAPLVADADPALCNGESGAMTEWQALRRSEAAPWIGLAGPRVLLRLPYGKSSDPIEAFAFEEFVDAPVHEEFLWGHASLAIAWLIGSAFTDGGWDMEPGDGREIGDLPAYTFVRDGEREMQACAERFLTEREVDRMLEAGLMPIASRRDRSAAVVVRVQSVADPPAPLVW